MKRIWRPPTPRRATHDAIAYPRAERDAALELALAHWCRLPHLSGQLTAAGLYPPCDQRATHYVFFENGRGRYFCDDHLEALRCHAYWVRDYEGRVFAERIEPLL